MTPFPKHQQHQQQKAGDKCREGDKQQAVRHGELKLNHVRTRRQQDAAHDEVAAQQFRRFAIHSHAPVRIVFVIQQQHGSRIGAGVKNNVFGCVTFVFNRAGIAIGCRHGRDRRGDEDGLQRVKIFVRHGFERGIVVRAGLPVGKKFGAGQGAGEFKERQVTVVVRGGRELFQLGRLRDAGFWNDVKVLQDAETMLNWIKLVVQTIQQRRCSEKIAGVGQLPATRDKKDFIHGMGSQS